ncbi:MAG TPA: LEA type 2 family protein [Bacteroidales bacterium]|nr:LEA type 2 family protein [Bacteroidales bacterium]
MKKAINVLLLIFFTCFFFSCKVQQLNIGNPEGMEIEELSMKSVRLKIMVPIENPNNFSFKVRNVNLDLLVNDRNVGKVKKLDAVKISAKSKEVYPVSFELTPKDAVTNILFLLGELQKRSPELEVTGSVTVSKLGIPYKIKVEHEQNFDNFKK